MSLKFFEHYDNRARLFETGGYDAFETIRRHVNASPDRLSTNDLKNFFDKHRRDNLKKEPVLSFADQVFESCGKTDLRYNGEYLSGIVVSYYVLADINTEKGLYAVLDEWGAYMRPADDDVLTIEEFSMLCRELEAVQHVSHAMQILPSLPQHVGQLLHMFWKRTNKIERKTQVVQRAVLNAMRPYSMSAGEEEEERLKREAEERAMQEEKESGSRGG